MHPLLQNWLNKIKITDVNKLSTDEKATFDDWNRVLSEGEITVEKITQFCKAQKRIVETQYTNPDNSEKKDHILKASLGFYNSMLNLLESPKAEKEAIEKDLIQKINSIK